MNMSRSNLFRKLKALTGRSATDFIRTLRLEKAKELLETTDLNVTEVCFKVGFGSPNYFSRAFQEQFGISPSELRRK
ncbi:MAG: HTH-type transcriptional regulator CdhR [Saprospiraceae bacterium]|nr:HTH-type transcriptional regulator CdhR [Saprospiraceae bacterium]